VSKATIGSVLAVSVLVALSGCGKQGTATKSPEAQKAPQAAEKPEGEKVAPPRNFDHPAPSVAPGASVDFSDLKKPEGGKTVGEIYAAKDQLAGKEVTVRGKVVKVSPNILGKTWLHVRDGSGADKTNDLTVTTTAAVPVELGLTVLVNGKVSLNKDFGLGYRYDVIIEDAKVTVEK